MSDAVAVVGELLDAVGGKAVSAHRDVLLCLLEAVGPLFWPRTTAG